MVTVQLQQNALRWDSSPLPLQGIWNTGGSCSYSRLPEFKLGQSHQCYLACCEHYRTEIPPSLLGYVARTVLSQLCALVFLTVKSNQGPVHQCAAVLRESYTRCFTRSELLLVCWPFWISCKAHLFWVTVGRELLQVRRVACKWKRWWYVSWCIDIYPTCVWHEGDGRCAWVLRYSA